MANEIFSPEHSSLNGLFTEGIKYIIPTYQRPYSWESIGKSDRNNQINNMWDDFFNFYSNSNDDSQEYFFGSIVVFKKDGFSQVVDGQQRLTSLLLLFSAMKCFLVNLQKNESDFDESIKKFLNVALSTFDKLLFNEEGLDLTQSLKVKIERASGFNFDEILNKVISCEDNSTVLQNIEDKYKDIANRYFSNRDYFIKQLEIEFLDNNTFTKEKAEELNKFGRFLRTKISVVVINTINFETAYNMFEVLNNRGLPLSAKDLFRNFIISEFDKNKQKEPEKKWNYLEESYEVTSDFLGRFIESQTGYQIQKSSFNALLDYYKSLSVVGSKIELFYTSIDDNLNYYTMILNDENIENKCIRNKVKFIKFLGHEKYSVNFLLTLFRAYKYDGQENQEILDFLTLYEKLRLYVLLTPYKRFSSSPIYNAIRALNSNYFTEAKESIAIDDKAHEELKDLINNKIYDNWNAKLLISKFLFTQYSTLDDVVEHDLNFNKATLEHILPQTPAKNTNWLKDFTLKFRNDITYKLGNFTLLTHNMNSRAKNYDFTKKQDEYKKTTLHITNNLSKLKSIDEVYFTNRHKDIVTAIYNDLEL
ncbi:MAG: hypothetical protein DRG78_16970 [Epsilonproteobacteria bacterium]|nr:MAG: hypothetical protein DRG78_16970 [Campylobacterota bacterium]